MRVCPRLLAPCWEEPLATGFARADLGSFARIEQGGTRRRREARMVYLSRIYTKSGDAGETGLGDGRRVPKDHPRVAAYGGVDELNAVLGLLLAQSADLPEAELL